LDKSKVFGTKTIGNTPIRVVNMVLSNNGNVPASLKCNDIQKAININTALKSSTKPLYLKII
jgi:hypothetical protein